MDTQELWTLFMETGAPEVYLWYNHARKMELMHVFDDSSARSAGNSLQ